MQLEKLLNEYESSKQILSNQNILQLSQLRMLPKDDIREFFVGFKIPCGIYFFIFGREAV